MKSAREDLRDLMRDRVLNALDRFANENLPMLAAADGWKDQDLPELFEALDRHFDRLIERYSIPLSA